MLIQNLSLEKYRNFAELSLSFDQKNLIVGRNGTGKSNIIEALRLLSTIKSFKTARLDEVVRFGDLYFKAKSQVVDGGVYDMFYGVQFTGTEQKERLVRIDEKVVSVMDYAGRYPTVLFTPADIDVVIGSPQGRRKYLDGILWQTSQGFRVGYVELGKILRERSSLLFLIKYNKADLDELQPWNELLVKASELVRSHRLELVRYINEKCLGVADIFGEDIEMSIEYVASSEMIDSFTRSEIKLTQNLYGPHRDDVSINYGGNLAKKYASRGQSRLAILMMKLAEAGYISEKLGNQPLILLDDIYSELNADRAEKLIEAFISAHYQVIATSIEEPAIDGFKMIDLNNGTNL